MPGPPRVGTGQLMELLSVSLGAYYGDFTAAAARENLTASQAKTLTVLRRGPAAMRVLAETLACDASNMTGIVDRLEKRSLVRREPSPGDRRVKNVVLTPEGEQAIDTIRANMHTTTAGLATLDDEDRATLYALLGRVFTVKES
ncbi:MarR family winged helix-turn-helix transcriptional regulator [Streptomyces flavofungini]|uniref:MarR family winged helix-turn-helix transcriptional regulator n=1 Tax=Streptomyces flavofungini TaxID=68200 RepID=UPI0025AFA677|nr:MarR family transcriptional regulator [Streptomyces flavofungini]WJV44324.1 MarR family transcriptional regulator [Streptomyces flavofungini]